MRRRSYSNGGRGSGRAAYAQTHAQMDRAKGKEHSFLFFDSPGAYLAHAIKSADHSYGASTRDSSREEWDLSAGWDGAVALGRDGWPEGREAIAPLTGRLIDSLSSRMSLETWTPRDEGEFFDVEDVLAGEPECWRTLQTVDGEGVARRRVQLAVTGCASGGVHAKALAARGAAICALIDLLEVAGFAVKVDTVFATGYDEDGCLISDAVTVKGYDERADMGMLAFWIGHPANLRRIAFASWEGRDSALRDRLGIRDGYGYGRVQDARELLLGYRPDIALPGPDLYIPGTYDAWEKADGAEKWIRKTMEDMGIKFTS